MVIQINGDTKIYILSRYSKKKKLFRTFFFSFWLHYFFFASFWEYLEENVH